MSQSKSYENILITQVGASSSRNLQVETFFHYPKKENKLLNGFKEEICF